MKEHLDKLSKDLASGMSRRHALRLFFVGLGAAVVGFSGRSASADGNKICVDLCRAQGLTGRDFGKCVSASAHCPPGECALCINGDDCVCVPVDDSNNVCFELCLDQGLEGDELEDCITASALCPPGECALGLSQGQTVCIPI